MATNSKTKRQTATVAQWGASVGLTRQSAYKAIKRCGIQVDGGMVDEQAATALYRSRTRTKTSGAGTTTKDTAAATPEPGSPDYWHARARRETAEASLAEDRLRIQRGELVVVAEYDKAITRHLIVARDAFLSLPARTAPVLFGKSIPQVQTLLDAEIRHTLNALAEGLSVDLH